MSSKVTIEDVRKLAKLSALHVADDEVEKLRNELDTIIQFVEQLDSVDTTNVEPTYQVTGLMNVTRKDDVIDYGVAQEALLLNAPDKQDSQLRVKRVL